MAADPPDRTIAGGVSGASVQRRQPRNMPTPMEPGLALIGLALKSLR